MAALDMRNVAGARIQNSRSSIERPFSATDRIGRRVLEPVGGLVAMYDLCIVIDAPQYSEWANQRLGAHNLLCLSVSGSDR